MTIGAMAMTGADVAFFTPPPHRPHRPERRNTGDRSVARALISAFRRELAHATEGGIPTRPTAHESD
jgi:hypothetical protein